MKKMILLLAFMFIFLGVFSQVRQTKRKFQRSDTYLRESFIDTDTLDVPTGWTIDSGTWTTSELDTSPLPYYNEGDKYLECTSTGAITIPSSQTAGTWEFSLYKTGDADNVDVSFLSEVAGDSVYFIILQGDEQILFYKVIDGAPSILAYTSVSYVDLSTWYRIKVEKTFAGEFTFYVRGGSFGDAYTLVDFSGGTGTNPITDTDYKGSSIFVVSLSTDNRFSNLKITR